MENSCKKRVLIIGAGFSGMHAINQFSSSKAFKVTCMEQLPVVGGLWNYSEVIKDEKHPVKSRYTAVYKNLRYLLLLLSSLNVQQKLVDIVYFNVN